MNPVWISIIGNICVAICSLIGVIYSSRKQYDRTIAEIAKHNAVVDEKIDTLTKRVDKHNNLVERTYKLEAQVEMMKKGRD